MIMFVSGHPTFFLIMPVLEAKTPLSFREQSETLFRPPPHIRSTLTGLRSSQWELTKLPKDPNNHPGSSLGWLALG